MLLFRSHRNEIVTVFRRFFQNIVVLRTTEVANFADISEIAMILIEKH